MNWCFYDKVVKNREEMELHQLINIGSCGLHIIHDSFKTHIEVADWDIKATAKDVFQILHNSPATRADYISVSGSNLFPLFCATCWVEDKKFAKQLLEIMPHISKVVMENVYNKKKFNLGFTAENKLQLFQRTVLVDKESATNFFEDVHSFVVAYIKEDVGKVTN